jgi:hypothetical protein
MHDLVSDLFGAKNAVVTTELHLTAYEMSKKQASMRAMCGLRTSGWSLPGVMSD